MTSPGPKTGNWLVGICVLALIVLFVPHLLSQVHNRPTGGTTSPASSVDLQQRHEDFCATEHATGPISTRSVPPASVIVCLVTSTPPADSPTAGPTTAPGRSGPT